MQKWTLDSNMHIWTLANVKAHMSLETQGWGRKRVCR